MNLVSGSPLTARWHDQLAPTCAALFIIGSLATIPYAAPPATWYMVLLAIVAAFVVFCGRFDRMKRWESVVIWPIWVLLGAWGISIATSGAPEISMLRSASMLLFSILFIAAQIAGWNERALRTVIIGIVGTMLVCVLDLAWQKWTGRSLIQGLDAASSANAGSQGNRNDLAVVSVLLPFSSVLIRGGNGLFLYLILAAASSPAWILSASRQTGLGWVIAVIGPFAARTSRRIAFAFSGILLAIFLVVVASSASLQQRAIQTWRGGLAERQEIIAFGAHLFWQHPLTGVGTGMYGAHYRDAAIKNWSWNGRALPKVGMPWVHSLPIEVLCETGLVGTAAILAILSGTILRLRSSICIGGTERELAIAISTALVVVLLIGLIDFSFVKDWFRCTWWLILGLAFANGHKSSLLRSPKTD